MTHSPPTLPAQPPRFVLDVYDRRCLALRAQCDEVRTLHAMGLRDALAHRLHDLALGLDAFFSRTAPLLRAEHGDGPDRASGDALPPAALPEALRLDLARFREDAARLASARNNGVVFFASGKTGSPPCGAHTPPTGESPDPGELARRGLALWRAGHLHCMSALPPVPQADIAASRRRWKTGGVALAVAVLGACLLVLGLPFLERGWQTLKRDNLKVELALGDAAWSTVRLAGFLGPERDGDKRWRWGVGPRAEIALELDAPRPVSLEYVLSNPLPDQDVTVTVNGRALARHPALPAAVGFAPGVRGGLRFQGEAGVNTVAFTFAKTNHFTFVQEATPYSVAFLQLTLATGLRATTPSPVPAP